MGGPNWVNPEDLQPGNFYWANFVGVLKHRYGHEIVYINGDGMACSCGDKTRRAVSVYEGWYGPIDGPPPRD